MLRQYSDTLTTTLDRLQAFLKEHEGMFNRQQDFEDQCGCYFNVIELETVHLNRLRRRFFQRMQRFDSMRDGLLSSSSLREARRSTKQGDNIGILTMVTVAYLPLGLASNMFSMSVVTPPWFMWVAWVAAAAMLAMLTFTFAFRNRITWRWPMASLRIQSLERRK